MGRPSKYTPEVAEAICADLAAGLSLRKACEKRKIGASTFLLWCGEKPELNEQYARAKDVGLEVWADEIEDIAADCPADRLEIDRARLRIDTRKWTLSKLLRKKYGDKIAVETRDMTLEALVEKSFGGG